jgi:hypothetical protein
MGRPREVSVTERREAVLRFLRRGAEVDTNFFTSKSRTSSASSTSSMNADGARTVGVLNVAILGCCSGALRR